MKHSPRTGVFFSLILGSLMILQPGCRSRPKEIPISTYSKEARNLFRDARAKFEFHHTEEADALLSAALKKDPLFAQAHVYKALTSSASDEIDQAIAKATTNASRTTKAEQVLISAIKAFRWENNPEKATELYHQLIELNPDDARARWLLGRVYIKTKETLKAIEQLERAIQIDPEFAPAFQDLGYRNLIRGDYQSAEEHFQKYLELVPDEPNSHDCIADLYTKTGRYEQAIDHYRKALELNPAFAISERNIGINLCFLGKFEEGQTPMGF
ncbi:MAG: tetratricopeptide repeat protein [Candidatus Aminicenantes bacterium]|nr:tetratricopeptide repeat protein [Candidatus Aminicenantes bacterium]